MPSLPRHNQRAQQVQAAARHGVAGGRAGALSAKQPRFRDGNSALGDRYRDTRSACDAHRKGAALVTTHRGDRLDDPVRGHTAWAKPLHWLIAHTAVRDCAEDDEHPEIISIWATHYSTCASDRRIRTATRTRDPHLVLASHRWACDR